MRDANLGRPPQLGDSRQGRLSYPGPLDDADTASIPEVAGFGSAATEGGPSGAVVSSNASITGLRRGLRSFTFNRRRTLANTAEDLWGPTGLHLLHSPPDPLVDFIFVHGLRGGSIKTWCKDEDLRLFWPQAWLPRDRDLRNVRIHAFGYDSDWGDTKETIHDLHDFGRSLLGEMNASPALRRGRQTPILLIGHSMGGLVMKKVRRPVTVAHASRLTRRPHRRHICSPSKTATCASSRIASRACSSWQLPITAATAQDY